MRINMKQQSSLLERLLKNEFDISVKHSKSIEMVARINGFSDYHAFLRGAEKIDKQIFFGKTIHTVSSRSNCSGEDAVSFILGHLFNTILKRKYCVMDTRGSLFGAKENPYSEIVTPISYFNSHLESSYRLIGDEAWTEVVDKKNKSHNWHYGYRGLLPDSRIFNEVLMTNSLNANKSKDKQLLLDYLRNKNCETAIVATRPFNNNETLPFVIGLDSATDFTPIYHIAVAHSYCGGIEHVMESINCIRGNNPQATIICWISSHEDDKYNNSGKNLPQRRFNEQNKHGDLEEIAGFGFVKDVNHIYKNLLNTLQENSVPFITIPYFKNYSVFTAGEYYSDFPITAQDVAVRDALAMDVLEQLVASGFVSKISSSPATSR